MNNIEWEYYIWEAEHPATIDQIKAVEGKLKLKFPSDFVEVALQHQGKSPEPCSFKVPGLWETVFCNLWHFSDDGDENTSHILYQHGSLIQLDKDDSEPKLTAPEKLVPFGRTPGGQDLCFDYRDDPANPKIIHFIHDGSGDDAIIFIANSFTEFLGMLHD